MSGPEPQDPWKAAYVQARMQKKSQAEAKLIADSAVRGQPADATQGKPAPVPLPPTGAMSQQPVDASAPNAPLPPYGPASEFMHQLPLGFGNDIRAGITSALGNSNFGDERALIEQSRDRFFAQNPVQAPLAAGAGMVGVGSWLKKGILGNVPGVGKMMGRAWETTGLPGIVARTLARSGEGAVFGAMLGGVNSIAGQQFGRGDVNAGEVLGDMQKSAKSAAVASAVLGPVLEGLANMGLKGAKRLQDASYAKFGAPGMPLREAPIGKAIMTKEVRQADRLWYEAAREAGVELRDPQTVIKLRNLAQNDDRQLLTFMDLLNLEHGGRATGPSELLEAAGRGNSKIRQRFTDLLGFRKGRYQDTGERLIGELETTFGKSRNIGKIHAAVKDQRSQLGDLYDLARQEGAQISDPRITAMLRDPRIRHAYEEARLTRLKGEGARDLQMGKTDTFGQNYPEGVPETFTLADLQLMRQGLDRTIEMAFGKNIGPTTSPTYTGPPPASRQEALQVLKPLRATLNEIMNSASPAFGKANAQYGALSDQLEGIQLAKGVWGRDPDLIEQELLSLGEGGQKMYLATAIRSLDHRLAGRTSRVEEVFTPLVQKRLAVLMAKVPGAAERFASLVQNEQMIATTNQSITPSVGQQDIRKSGGAGSMLRSLGYLAGGNVAFGAAAGLQSALKAFESGLLEDEAMRIAKIGTATGNELLDAINALSKNPIPRFRAVNQAASIGVLSSPPGIQYQDTTRSK